MIFQALLLKDKMLSYRKTIDVVSKRRAWSEREKSSPYRIVPVEVHISEKDYPVEVDGVEVMASRFGMIDEVE